MTPAVTTRVSALPTGTAFARYCLAKAIQEWHGSGSAIEAAKVWRETPTVLACLEAELEGKAAVSPGMTTDATWAGPLAVYGIAGEALQLLRGSSILGALEGKVRRVPFHSTVPRETGTGTGGAWIGQGLATPVAATAYDTLTQPVYKAGVIVVLTRELVTLGDPDAERTVRDTVIAGVGAYLDAQLLTPTVTLVTGLRPAAITNGATEVTSTGSTAAQITADLTSLIAAITTSGGGLTWIMRPTTAGRVAASLGAAASDLPRTLFGIPLVTSANSPAQITLVDASQVLYSSDDRALDVSTSQSALVQMDSAPVDPTVAATVMTSLFERNLWGLKVVRPVAWLRAQTGAVAWMTVAY